MSVDRRTFLQLVGALAADAGFLEGGSPAQAQAPSQPHAPQASPGPVAAAASTTINRKNVVGIQVKPFAWGDEGIDKLLDTLQSKGNVNTVFAYTYDGDPNRTTQGGAIPLPDHGKYGPTGKLRVGGAFYDYDQKYFRGTTLKDFRSPDEPGFNVITAVAPKMKARGMDFFAWDYNNAFPVMMRSIPGFTEVAEVDVYGKRTASACFNNPDYRAHLTGKIESYLAQYPDEVRGIMWGCERMGPIDNMIGGGWATVGICCFCPFCLEKARIRGINIDRAREGYMQMDALFQRAASHGLPQARPADGVFTTFMRILFRYPEVLSWNMLWNDSYHEVRASLYGTAKALAPEKPFGFHIVQNITFSPFYKAVDDYESLAEHADFLKLATYNNAAGPRMAHFVDRLCATIFADGTPADLGPMYYKMMGLQEAPLDQIVTKGLSTAYLTSETKRAIDETGGRVQIYPGIDIDVPTATGEKHTTPEDVVASTKAAFAAGANGVVLSREYHEMWMKNLSAAGETTRSLFGM